MSDTTPSIDRIDRKILNLLQPDGRVANFKLAEAVALSPTAVLWQLPGVRETRTYAVMEEVKNTTRLALDA